MCESPWRCWFVPALFPSAAAIRPSSSPSSSVVSPSSPASSSSRVSVALNVVVVVVGRRLVRCARRLGLDPALLIRNVLASVTAASLNRERSSRRMLRRQRDTFSALPSHSAFSSALNCVSSDYRGCQHDGGRFRERRGILFLTCFRSAACKTDLCVTPWSVAALTASDKALRSKFRIALPMA